MGRFIPLLALLVAGCAGSVRSFTPPAEPMPFEGRSLVVQTREGRSYDVTNLRIGPDTTTWTVTATGLTLRAATCRIAEVSRREAVRGARNGMVAGASVGAVLAFMLAIETEGSEIGPDGADEQFAIAASGAFVVGLVGGLVGMVASPRTHYELPPVSAQQAELPACLPEGIGS